MKKVLFLALAAGMFSFASCDSKKENANEEKADQVEQSTEQKADQIENNADATADSVRDQGEHTADSLEAAH